MTESKFTKGPWTVEEVEPSAWVDRKTYNVVSGGVTIVGTEGLFLSEEEDRANAHLIAAAPELYEALLRATIALRSVRVDILADEFEAVLVKAEGRS